MRASIAAVPVLAVALLAAACGSREGAAAATGGLTVLNPVGDRPFFDFGRVPYGAKVEHVFQLRNDDTKPVAVRDLIASCSCAQPRIAYTAADGKRVEGNSGGGGPVITLPPGSTAELAVRVDTEHVQALNVDKLASVRIRSDSAATPFLTLEVHLVVDRVMRAVPSGIELGQTPQSVGRSGRTDVVNDVPGSLARVTGIESIEGPFTATLDEADLNGTRAWILIATAKPDLPLGPANGRVMLATTTEDGTGVGASFLVPVTAQISPEVVLRPAALPFGAIAMGTAARVEADLETLVPGERVRVLDSRVTTMPEGVAQWIAAEATAVDPAADGAAAHWKIVLQSWPRLEEPTFSGTLVLTLDHPKVKEIRASFSGTVR
jgi:hypothetical protein